MAKYLKILLYSSLILIFVANCIDPFYPDIEEYENVMVVDSFITNENTVYHVKLSRTQRFNDLDKKPVPGAIVQVIDDSGNTYLFRETEAGSYESNPGEFVGQIGRKYKLIIETKDGNKYESGFEEMKKVQFTPFEVKVRGVGAFPHLHRLNVIWVGLTEGADHMQSIFNQLEPSLRSLGFRADSKGFSPHITIARVRSARNKNELVECIKENADFEFGTVKAECLRLKRSDLTPQGPIYLTLKEFCPQS